MDSRSVSFKNSKKSSPIWHSNVILFPTMISCWYGRSHVQSVEYGFCHQHTGYVCSKREIPRTVVSSFFFHSRTVRAGGVSPCLARRGSNLKHSGALLFKAGAPSPSAWPGKRNRTTQSYIVQRQIETAPELKNTTELFKTFYYDESVNASATIDFILG